MRSFVRVAFFTCALALALPFAAAAEFEADTEGPWINVDVIDLTSAGDATYLDYLGRGYIALLDALKSEGMVLDYGTMMKTTGNADEGDVVVWWSVKSLADYEKALARMSEISAEMWTGDELADLWKKLEQVRTLRSSNLYRAVVWNKSEE